jgi:hypothetical protein
MIITLNIPDAIAPEVRDALTTDYIAVNEDGTPNPISRQQHAKNQIIQFIKSRIRILRQEKSRGALQQSLDNDITIT